MVRTPSFCSEVSEIQHSNSSLVWGVSSTVSFSAKNCDMEIPKPLQIASRVAMDGMLLLL